MWVSVVHHCSVSVNANQCLGLHRSASPLLCNSNPAPDFFTHGAPVALTVNHSQIEGHENPSVPHRERYFYFNKNTGVHGHRWHHASNTHAHAHTRLTADPDSRHEQAAVSGPRNQDCRSRPLWFSQQRHLVGGMNPFHLRQQPLERSFRTIRFLQLRYVACQNNVSEKDSAIYPNTVLQTSQQGESLLAVQKVARSREMASSYEKINKYIFFKKTKKENFVLKEVNSDLTLYKSILSCFINCWDIVVN